MQLYCILKIGKNRILEISYRVVSFLMVMLFFSMNLVQTFHAHDRIMNPEQSAHEDFTSTAEKCKICEYYIRKQIETTHLSYPPVLATALPTLFDYNTNLYLGKYKFTLQGFTNKGPPQLLS